MKLMFTLKKFPHTLLFITLSFISLWLMRSGYASQSIEGCFIAEESCEAFQSIKKKTNPNDIKLVKSTSYKVMAKNKKQASHYQVKIDNIAFPQRWVSISCGRYVANCTASSGATTPTTAKPASTSALTIAKKQYLLALSWEPTFCESHQRKTECKSLNAKRYDASHLSLHGLWPQPRNNAYCGINSTEKAIDRRGKWHLLPKLPLSKQTIEALKIAMPGFSSNLQRHEWIKHGSCYGTSANQYYQDAMTLTRQFNASQVGVLLASKIGSKVSKKQIDAALEASFGKGTASKVSMKCDRKGRFSELWIYLGGNITPEASFAALLKSAKKAAKGNCLSGVVDPA